MDAELTPVDQATAPAVSRLGRSRRWVRRLGIAAAVVGVLIMALLIDAWTALGASASGQRRQRLEASPQFVDGRFVNLLPMADMDYAEMTIKWLQGGAHREPSAPPPVVERRAIDFAEPPPSGLRLTWLGHSSVLIEIDGRRVLTDPNWSERSGPLSFFGPRRFFPPPLPLEEVPDLDAVIISHDHYDHLDLDTVRALGARGVTFVTPLGVGAHLAYWGIAEDHIVELDWWERTEVAGLELVATPARHFSGRSLGDRDRTLWAGWALLGPNNRVFYSGDTAMFPSFDEIGRRLGPFDVTLLDSGAYNAMWRDVHLGPEQAVAAPQALGGKLLIPVHWGTFNLALHGWTEPAERLLVAADRRGVRLAIPQPGESIEPARAAPPRRWWPELPWVGADREPVISSGLGDPPDAAD